MLMNTCWSYAMAWSNANPSRRPDPTPLIISGLPVLFLWPPLYNGVYYPLYSKRHPSIDLYPTFNRFDRHRFCAVDFSVAATNVGVLLFRAAVEMNLWVSFCKARRGIIYLASEKGAVALGLGAQELAAVTYAPCAEI